MEVCNLQRLQVWSVYYLKGGMKRFEYEDEFERLKREEKYEEALKLLRCEADEKKNPKAQVEYGLCCLRGAMTLETENMTEAVKYFKLSSDNGWPRGQYQYGKTLYAKHSTREQGLKLIEQALASDDEYVKGMKVTCCCLR